MDVVSSYSEAKFAKREEGKPRSNRMFNWLIKQFSGDEDAESLGGERGLEAFVARLSLITPASAIEAVSEQFEKAHSLELPGEKLERALKQLDERAQDPLTVVGLKLFEDKLGRKLSDTVWLTMARYYRNAHAGYRVCLESSASRDLESNSQRNDAALIASRAMAALCRYKTLMRMRYREIDLQYWDHALELSLWCTQWGTNNTLVDLYPHAGVQTTFEREYLVSLLFEAAPVANLSAAQMLALEIILRRFAASYLFWNEYSDSTPFVVDLKGDSIVRRWLKGLKPRTDLRYFGMADAYAQLETLHKQAKRSREIPEWLMEARLDHDSYRGLLDLLVAHWSAKPPQRRHRRNRSHGEMRVIHGIPQVRRLIAATEYVKGGGRLDYEESTPYDFKLFGRLRFGAVTEESSKDSTNQDLSAAQTLERFEFEGDARLTEGWSIVDVSDSGLGAVAHIHDGWARIGMLLGIRKPGSFEWQLAVITRISRPATGKLSIGMTTIPGTAYCAQLRIATKEDGEYWAPLAESADVEHNVILLRQGKSTYLFLEQGIFTGALECKISVAKRWRSVKLERSVGLGYDFEQVSVSIFG